MLIYDIEILKAVLPRNGERLEGVDYCDGWDDKANMGVACICAYDFIEKRYRVFTGGTFADFAALAAKRFVIGFNSITFDDVVCGHESLSVKTDWDLLQEIWVAAGLGRAFEYPSHTGFGLDAMAKANGGTGKTGYGGTAPIDWQMGLYGKVIDYCLEDVRQTTRLVRRVLQNGYLINPKNEDERLIIKPDPKMLAIWRDASAA